MFDFHKFHQGFEFNPVKTKELLKNLGGTLQDEKT